ncbi:MAG: caspase family protein [Planctomycetota bacterium]
MLAAMTLLLAMCVPAPPPGTCQALDDAPAPQARIRNRVALIVAIDRYEHEESDGAWQNLSGCVNDGRLAIDLLEHRFGFPPESIKSLFNEQSTHAAIVQSFYDWLILQSSSDTEAVFWFSGHGSQLPDASGYSGAESEGKDSSYVAYDSRQRGASHSFDISDDEMCSLVCALSRRTPRITIITDSCHSGGAVRGIVARTVRRAAQDGQNPITLADVKSFWPPIPFLDDGDPARASAAYVHLAACADDEAALEYEVEDGAQGKVTHGLFTYFLTRALEAMPTGTTYEQLACDVGARVSSSTSCQHVQVEGQRDRLVFGSRFEAPPPGFQGTIAQDGRIEILGGSLQQLQRGSLLAIVDLRLAAIGKARLDDVRLTTSSASWVGAHPEPGEVVAIRAIEVDRPSAERPFRILVPGRSPLEHQIAAALSRLPNPSVEVLRSPDTVVDYQLVLDPAHARCELVTVPDGVTLWQEANDAEGERAAAIVDGVRAKLTSEVYHRALLKMLGSKGRVAMTLDLAAAAVGQPTNGASRLPARIEHLRARGLMDAASERIVVYDRPALQDVATLTIRVAADERPGRDLYLSVLCVSDNHDVVLLTPISPRVHPGDVHPVPIEVFGDPDANGTSRDRYLVIATNEPADFSMFVSRRVLIRGSGTVTPDTSVEIADGVPSPIAQAVSAAGATRGIGGISRRVDFGIATLDVVVKPEKP